MSLFDFLCVFILLAVAEKDGVSLQGIHFKSRLMTLEPVTSPKNLLNKLKITNEMLDSQSRHTRMFLCTKLKLHLLQWMRLNFELVRLSPKGKHRFPFVHRIQALLKKAVIWMGDHLDRIPCAVLLGKLGWCKHQSRLPLLLQMLYVD